MTALLDADVLPQRRARRALAAHVVEQPLLRGAYSLMLNTGVTAALGVAFWVVAAHAYSAAAVGSANAAINAMLFVSGVSQLNMNSTLSRFLPVAGRSAGRFIAACYALACCATGVAATVFVVVERGNGALYRSSVLAAVCFVVASVGWTVFTLQDAALAGLRAAHWVPVENGVFGAVKLVLLVVFAGAGSAMGIFAPWVIGVFAALPPINYLVFRRLVPRLRDAAALPARASVVRFAAGDYAGSLMNFATVALVPVIVVARMGPTRGAFFGVAWTVAMTADLLAMNMSTILTVEGTHAPGDLARLVVSASRHVLVIALGLAVAVSAGGGLVLRVFGGSYAHSGAGVLRLMGFAIVARSVNSLTIGVLRVRRRTGTVAAMYGVVATCTLGATLTLTGSLGISAPAFGWLAGQTLVALWSGRYLIRVGRAREERAAWQPC